MESNHEKSGPGGAARRRAAMAVLLTAGMLAAMWSFSGVGFAKNSHTPAHHQYKHH